jgi:hypothetical protein
LGQKLSLVRSSRYACRILDIRFFSCLQGGFPSLNPEWINPYFEPEEMDNQIPDHPGIYILASGGHILMACYQEQIVGTCALMNLQKRYWKWKKWLNRKGTGPDNRAATETGSHPESKRIRSRKHRIILPSFFGFRPSCVPQPGFQDVPCPPNGYKRSDI